MKIRHLELIVSQQKDYIAELESMLLRNQNLSQAPIRISKFTSPPSEDVLCEEDEEANLIESDEELNDSRNRVSELFRHNRN